MWAAFQLPFRPWESTCGFCPLHRQCKDMDVRFFRKKLGLELGAQTIPLRIGQTTRQIRYSVYVVENDGFRPTGNLCR